MTLTLAPSSLTQARGARQDTRTVIGGNVISNNRQIVIPRAADQNIAAIPAACPCVGCQTEDVQQVDLDIVLDESGHELVNAKLYDDCWELNVKAHASEFITLRDIARPTGTRGVLRRWVPRHERSGKEPATVRPAPALQATSLLNLVRIASTPPSRIRQTLDRTASV